jgi:hypothetical protein
MQDDGLDSEALDAWNNPHKYINNIEYTPEELHAPLYTVLRKNIKTKLEIYEYKKYRIVKEEKNNKTIYVIEEICLSRQPCWWRDMFGLSQLWQLHWASSWFGYGLNKEPLTCLKDAEYCVNKLVEMLNKQQTLQLSCGTKFQPILFGQEQDAKIVPSKTIISIRP